MQVRVSFRNGFYAGLLCALVLGLYLFQLWQPEKQVSLHSLHLLKALEEKNWKDAGDFVDQSYADRWGHDRNLLLARLRAVLPYARNLRFSVIAPAVSAEGGERRWSARLIIEAEPNEVSELIKQRINSLDAPFQLTWQRGGKPWAWKMVRADNVALEQGSID